MTRWRSGSRVALLSLALGSVVLACGEDLDGGAACPALCPGQSVSVLDTTFDAVVLDTTLAGFPPVGLEGSLSLISRGDSVDARAVVRFDSLPSTFIKAGGDSAIVAVDSAYLLFIVNAVGTRLRGGPVRFDLFDVDTTAADSSLDAVRALFRADRLLGGSTIDSAQVKDSIKVFFNNTRLLPKITGKQRLRVGIRATSALGVEVDLGSVEGGQSSLLRFDPAPADTAIRALTVAPRSTTPVGQADVASDFLDYAVVVKAPTPPGGPSLFVGGLPARRVFLRFQVPARITDSSTVLRATLLLTQFPNRDFAPRDSAAIVPQLVTAGEEVVDLNRAALLISAFAFDTLRIAPGDSGARSLEVATAVRQWAASTTFRPQRAIVLRSTAEGASGFAVNFFSSEAPAALRPRLRINYALRTSFGIP